MEKELNEKMVKDRGFVVEEFMARDLHLKGFELMVYAIIYSDCQEKGAYTGGIGSITERINATKKTVYNALNLLIGKGLIIKAKTICNGVTYNEYKAVRPSDKEERVKTELDVDNGDLISRETVYTLLSHVLKFDKKLHRNDKESALLYSGCYYLLLKETEIEIINYDLCDPTSCIAAYERINRIYVEFEDCGEPLGLVIELDDGLSIVLPDKKTIVIAADR